MDSGIGRNTDRISKLPDSVLCHILSFLPTKYAVGTSILSRRWQYLWTCVTSLDFDDSVLFHPHSEVSPDGGNEVDLNFENFVNRVLCFSDASCLKNFSLRLNSFCNLDLVNMWIGTAIKRDVQKLVLYYNPWHEYNPVQLPRMAFTSKTLVDLSLDGDILLKVPASIWLPSLKILNLVDIKFENEDSAQELFSGCPVLEELFIYWWNWDIQQVLNISVPTLKHLMVTRLGYKFYHQFHDSNSIDESNDQRYKLVVNAPKLEHLHLTDYVAEDLSLENLSSLSKANLVIGPSFARSVRSTKYDGRIFKLLSGIANVKFLAFATEVKDYVLPTFRNLTHLRLCSDRMSGWNLDLVKEFLEHSPNLEVLILEGIRDLSSAKFWSSSLRVPSCLLLHLKEIEIWKFVGEVYELEVIEYLLKNAKVLKKMTIDCQYSDSYFCKELEGFPRGSKTCQLNLL